ncbi:MAG: protein kinase [Planctomycetota bacterium]
MSTPAPVKSTLAGPKVAGYRLIEAIGRGTFGEVWLAEELLTGLRRAVKLLPKTPQAGGPSPLRELKGVREYQEKSKDHPCLLQIYHVGETPECYYYAMELADPTIPASPPDGAVEAEVAAGVSPAEEETGLRGRRPLQPAPGPPRQSGSLDTHRTDADAGAREYRPLTLAALIAREAPMPAARALDITAQVLRGLEHLHAQGLIHRDVKPSNVLVVGGQIKLGDMGLVTTSDRDVTLTYQAFDLYARKDRPAREVAKLLGLSRNAVYIAKTRILARLREKVFGWSNASP